ncbi:MAG TPA: hypothetical protein VGS08_05865 [Candidatus Saccharimonadales bacterium]|nr:hypothetical protein [Candidatus Saccharimonadales bacterium]
MSREALGTPEAPIHSENVRPIRGPETVNTPPGGTEDDQEMLGGLAIQELLEGNGINPEAAQSLTRDLARKEVYRAYRAAAQYAEFTPSVATAIAHYDTPSLRVVYPTAQQIKEQRFGARLVSGFLGFFSSNWSQRFDSYLERRGRQAVTSVAQQTTRTIKAIGEMETPKSGFVKDVSSIHADIRSSYSNLPNILDKLSGLSIHSDEEPHEDKDKDYPTLSKLAKLSGVSNRLALRKRTVRSFAPEINKGIEQFLSKQGVEVPETPEQPLNTLTRRLAKRFVPKRVERIPSQVEDMLTNIYGVLPESGMKFRSSFYDLCRHIGQRHEQGESGTSLTKKLLREIDRLIG